MADASRLFRQRAHEGPTGYSTCLWGALDPFLENSLRTLSVEGRSPATSSCEKRTRLATRAILSFLISSPPWDVRGLGT